VYVPDNYIGSVDDRYTTWRIWGKYLQKQSLLKQAEEIRERSEKKSFSLDIQTSQEIRRVKFQTNIELEYIKAASEQSMIASMFNIVYCSFG